MLGTLRPYRLVWTDSCRHARSFASLDAALRAVRNAAPCKIKPCAWIVQYRGSTMAGGVGPDLVRQ